MAQGESTRSPLAPWPPPPRPRPSGAAGPRAAESAEAGVGRETRSPEILSPLRQSGPEWAEKLGWNPELRGTPLGSGYRQLNRQAPSGV